MLAARLSPELFTQLLDENPEFRARMEERVLQYDFQRLARVPLDFADEILPAEASAADGFIDGAEALAPEPPRSRTCPTSRRRRSGGCPGSFPHVFQLDEMDCGAACLGNG